MKAITDISGRLGNQMFQFAFLYAYARDNNFPLVDNALGYYYQEPKYFEGYEDEIKQLFSSDVPQKIDQVAIHVRRGDYVGHPFYIDLSETDYYERAMEQFPAHEFLVFSDDIEWCREQEVFKDCEFVTSGDDVFDMNLMSACTGHIIANSSYSWWAAYISPYTKKVIAPKEWYTDGAERTKCPHNWIKI